MILPLGRLTTYNHHHSDFPGQAGLQGCGPGLKTIPPLGGFTILAFRFSFSCRLTCPSYIFIVAFARWPV
jgi:hypothetical protein